MKKFSQSRELILEDWKKIGKGALIAMGGAAVAYFLEALPGMELGKYSYLLIPILSILLNAAQKYFRETRY